MFLEGVAMYIRFTCPVFLLAVLVMSTGAASAQPSFSCGAKLNQTENTICDSGELSQLDFDMAGLYRAIFAARSEAEQSKLAAEQRAWLRTRNACRADMACLRNRYLDRIAALQSLQNLPEPESRTVELRWTILPDGTMERPLADGGTIRRDPNGWVDEYDADGTIRDDGMEAIQVQPPALPSLPGELSDWGQGLEFRLLNVLDNILTPEEMEAGAKAMMEQMAAGQH